MRWFWTGLLPILGCACTSGRASRFEDLPAESPPSAGGDSASVGGQLAQPAAGASTGGVSGGHAAAGSTGSGGAPVADTGGFIRRSGRSLVVDGKPVTLRGISFGNEVWTNDDIPWNHHSEQDFDRLQSWGMNVVRFYLSYDTFLDVGRPGELKQEAWDWLDTNLAWAKARGIYLLLNVHVPPGGFQPGADGNALWDNPANQQALTQFWAAIAERYRDETIIAGYDLLNEPDVSSAPSQWQKLAGELVAAIRQIDQNHLIVVERTNAVNQNYTWDGNMNWFLVQDENVMYTFHFYGPFTYTHQGADWAGLGGNYSTYPDAGQQEHLDRGGGQFPRTKQYLEAAIQQYVEFGVRNNVPLLLGEFGTIEATFQDSRGGAQWVGDMVEIARAKDVHFIYHTYHEDNFGVFLGYGTPVDPNRANQGLLGVISTAWK